MPDPVTENRHVIERFYDAFDRCDGETMAGCYLPDATFRDPVFGEGSIARHTDGFSFFALSRQALGPTGLVLGWNPIGRRMVRQRARSDMDRFSAANPPGQAP